MAYSLPLPLSILATARMAVGGSSFLLPSFTSHSFHYPIPTGSNLAMRLFGSRDFIMGLFLFLAKCPETTRNAVLVGMAVDALDAAACAFGWARGEIDDSVLAIFGGGAVSFLMLGALGFKMGGLGKVVAAGAGKM